MLTSYDVNLTTPICGCGEKVDPLLFCHLPATAECFFIYCCNTFFLHFIRTVIIGLAALFSLACRIHDCTNWATKTLLSSDVPVANYTPTREREKALQEAHTFRASESTWPMHGSSVASSCSYVYVHVLCAKLVIVDIVTSVYTGSPSPPPQTSPPSKGKGKKGSRKGKDKPPGKFFNSKNRACTHCRGGRKLVISGTREAAIIATWRRNHTRCHRGP